MKKTWQNGQIAVCYHGREEAQRLYKWLDGNGYKNIQGLSPENYTFPVVCVDESGIYFGTNTTCMAAAASKGIHALSLSGAIKILS